MSDGINLRNPGRYPIRGKRLAQASRVVLDAHSDCQKASLCILLTDARQICAMNRKYAHVDSPTDVLAFPADPLFSDFDETRPYLGDIVIAHDYVSAQAAATGAVLDDVLRLLVIHGTLHLLGYTHNTSEARDCMWAAQAGALRSIEIDPIIVDQYGNLQDD